MKMITPAQLRRTAEKTKLDDESLIVCALSTEICAPEDAGPESRTLDFTISSETVDSYRDVINADGWKLDRFLKNPVVLWAHSHWTPPVGRAVNTRVEDKKLKSSAEFPEREISAFADDVFKMLKAKFLRATSVGFIPLEWTWDDERGGFNFLKQELFEFSIVPVPANPDTLVNSIANGRADDVDLAFLKDWCEQTLDLWRPDGHVALWVPRHSVEEVHAAISNHKTSVAVTDTAGDVGTVIRDSGTAVSPSGHVETTITDDPYFEFWSPNAGFRNGDPEQVVTAVSWTVNTDDDREQKILDSIEALRKEIAALSERLEDEPDVHEDGIADDPTPDEGSFDIVRALHANDEDAQDDLVNALRSVLENITNPKDIEADDIDPELLRSVVAEEAERAIMKRTGKLPKEV
jgi:HK97 family phage prohead protease